MTPLPVSTKAVRVWIETWAGSDYNASHFYLQFQKGAGPWDERREITRRVTAADRDLLWEQYAVGDETGRFNSLRDAVVAAVAVARERYGADVAVEFGRPYCSVAFAVGPADDPATVALAEL